MIIKKIFRVHENIFGSLKKIDYLYKDGKLSQNI